MCINIHTCMCINIHTCMCINIHTCADTCIWRQLHVNLSTEQRRRNKSQERLSVCDKRDWERPRLTHKGTADKGFMSHSWSLSVSANDWYRHCDTADKATAIKALQSHPTPSTPDRTLGLSFLTHIRTRVCLCASAFVCVCVNLYICIYTCTYIQYIYKYRLGTFLVVGFASWGLLLGGGVLTPYAPFGLICTIDSKQTNLSDLYHWWVRQGWYPVVSRGQVPRFKADIPLISGCFKTTCSKVPHPLDSNKLFVRYTHIYTYV